MIVFKTTCFQSPRLHTIFASEGLVHTTGIDASYPQRVTIPSYLTENQAYFQYTMGAWVVCRVVTLGISAFHGTQLAIPGEVRMF